MESEGGGIWSDWQAGTVAHIPVIQISDVGEELKPTPLNAVQIKTRQLFI